MTNDILVYVEHLNGSVTDATYEMLATARALAGQTGLSLYGTRVLLDFAVDIGLVDFVGRFDLGVQAASHLQADRHGGCREAGAEHAEQGHDHLRAAVNQGLFELEVERFFQVPGTYESWQVFEQRYIHVTHTEHRIPY